MISSAAFTLVARLLYGLLDDGAILMSVMINRVERSSAPARTEFQLHVEFEKRGQGNVIDFTERKLMAIVRKLRDVAKKEQVLALLADYKAGKVAVAWSNAQPMYTAITKG